MAQNRFDSPFYKPPETPTPYPNTLQLGDIVLQKLNPVSAHQSEKGVVPPFKVGLPELELDGGELAPQDADEKVSTPVSSVI